MAENKETKKKSHVGMGIVYGLVVGAALGFAFDNYALWVGIGISLGIVIGAILDMRSNRKPSQEL